MVKHFVQQKAHEQDDHQVLSPESLAKGLDAQGGINLELDGDFPGMAQAFCAYPGAIIHRRDVDGNEPQHLIAYLVQEREAREQKKDGNVAGQSLLL